MKKNTPGAGQSRWRSHICISWDQWSNAVKWPSSHGLQYTLRPDSVNAGAVPKHKIDIDTACHKIKSEKQCHLWSKKHHHHHHFICPIIQQYVHLQEYDSRRAGQQGPIRILTAALKTFNKNSHWVHILSHK